MPNIYGMMDVGRTALISHQKAIDIIGNNIANANTPGYSRQRVNLEQNAPVRYQGGTMSTGVHAKQRIQRAYDQFLAAQITDQKEGLGRWTAQKEALEKAELMFDETSGYGLNKAFSEFWNAWQDLSNNPTGHVERVTVVSRGQNLAETFKKLRQDLVSVQEDADDRIADLVDEINTIAEQIADLNGKITRVEVSGHAANDYRDERDLLLNKLADMVEINSFEDGDGNIIISVGDGKPLVDGGRSWSLTTGVNASGYQDVYWVDSSASNVNITGDIDSGRLKGWIQSRDSLIAGYITKIDTLASTVISRVNALHGAGYGLDGSQNDFFSGSSASDMAVNSAVVSDVNLVAAAGTSAGLPGDNSTAIAIAALQESLTMSSGTTTFDGYYDSLVSDVGADTRDAAVNLQHQDSMITRLEAYREQVAGVSLDEEMVELIQAQHAYNAAAKLITSADEMMATLIGMVR